jgi:AraC-like DNA-binding protein
MPLHETTVTAGPVAGVHITESSSAQRFERHWHAWYGFGLLDSGGQKWRSRSGTVEARPGQIINTVPGEVHDGQPVGAQSRRWRIVSIEPDVMSGLIDHAGESPDLARPVIDDGLVAGSIERMFREAATWRCESSVLATLAFEEALVESCVLLMARHASARAPSAAVGNLSAVRDRLAEDLIETPTLAELASLAGLSKYQVLRGFQNQYGLPPHRWLHCLRAERARSLIQSGMSLATAASASGFADQAHMTRTFGRIYGFTPGAWRRACKWRPSRA